MRLGAVGRCAARPAGSPRPADASHASPARVRRTASGGRSAIRWCGAACVTATRTMSPGRGVASPGAKCTSLPSGARPDSRCVATSLRPSPSATSTSSSRPSSTWLPAQVISSTSAASRPYRSLTTSAGTWPGMSAAAVPGRLEYWNVKAPANRAWRTTSSVSSKSRSVSPGKPTMMSVVMAAVGDLRADLIDDPQILVPAVGTAHRPQHRVGAGLQRHVQLRHDVRGLRHRRDHVAGEVARMGRGEPHPLQPLDLAAGAKQFPERLPVAERRAVGVDVLPEQRHLEYALADQGTDLGEDVAGAPVLAHGREGSARCRTCTCCCTPPRWRPRPSRRIRGGPAAPRGTAAAPPRSRPAPRQARAHVRAAQEASRCYASRRRRPPRGHDGRSRPCPSAPGNRRPRSACPGGCPSPGGGDRGSRKACCPRSPAPRRY